MRVNLLPGTVQLSAISVDQRLIIRAVARILGAGLEGCNSQETLLSICLGLSIAAVTSGLLHAMTFATRVGLSQV